MAQIAAGTLHKYLTGEVVTGDDTQIATNINIVFETIRLALNDTDTKVANTYTVSAMDALLNAIRNGTAIQAGAINYNHIATGALDVRYFTETELNSGQLDNRYYTSTLLNSGQLDNRYYTETEIDAKVATLNSADASITSALTTHKTSTDHDSRYYTRTLMDAGQLDNRYFTETELQSATPGASGASKIGATPIATSPSDVQGILVWLKNQIDSAVVGTIPDQSITDTKLAFSPVHVPFGVATGSANTYAVTIAPAPTSYSDGLALAVKINVDSSAASTINVNGIGPRPIKKANGNDVTNLKANGVYTLRYNITTSNFILQGEGGGGTATNADVLAGKTAVSDAGDLVGTMVNQPGVTSAVNGFYTGGLLYTRLNKGAYLTNSGAGAPEVTLTSSQLASAIGGNAIATQVLNNQMFSSGAAGISVFGSMPDRGAMSINASSTNQTIPVGYHNGSGVVNAVTFNAGALLEANTVAGTTGTMLNQSNRAGATSGHTPALDATYGVYTAGNPNARVYLKPPAGYYDGVSWVAIDQPSLDPSNVRVGTAYLNVVGTMQPRQFATGSGTTSGTTCTCVNNNTSANETFMYQAVVNGLSFLPRTIQILNLSNSVSTWWTSDTAGYIAQSSMCIYYHFNGSTFVRYTFKPGGNMNVTATGFVLPTHLSGTSFMWWAWA